MNPPRLVLVLMIASALPCVGAVDFNREIKPILSNKCYACHGPDEEERQAKLRLDTRDGAVKSRRGRQGIVPGDPDASTILQHVLSDDPDEVMPPPDKGTALNDGEIALLRQWILEGAEYAEHWSYTRVERPPVPEGLADHPVDAFLLEKLRGISLGYSEESDRHRLARRVAMDLTGLPPERAELEAFVNDGGADAYERFVDKQLAKPGYGEHMARGWLDIARYADSAGYADDPLRTIWAYRDWVVRAFDDNMPFDEFTIAQLAGDLLPEPGEDELIATAFHRNTLTNNEGGTDDEEFRIAAVVDRVGTTFEAWMGTTMACAQCHTHKYDPITHEDYFRVFAIFNNTADADRLDEAPRLELLSGEQKEMKRGLEEELADVQRFLETPSAALEAAQGEWEARLKGADPWVAVDGPAIRLGAERLVGAVRLAGAEISEEIGLRWVPAERVPPGGRYVRVSLEGAGKMIHLAELEVFSGGENLARMGVASQSSTDFGGDAVRVNDGDTNGAHEGGSVTHTAVSGNPWLEIDLGRVRTVDRITVWNRTDGDTEERLRGYRIELLDEERRVVWGENPEDVPAPSSSFELSGERDLVFSEHRVAGERVLVLEPAFQQVEEGVLVVEAGGGELRHAIAEDGKRVIERVLAPDLQAILAKTAGERSVEEAGALAAHFRTISPLLDEARGARDALVEKLGGIMPYTSVPVMREVGAAERRTTHIHIRGNFRTPGDEVEAGVPSAFPALPEGVVADRLALARWMVDRGNPLTARATVNRLWEGIFGTGIVATPEEFGAQGELPSHPELLDWLAAEFMESGWDVKHVLRLMVTSRAYRQSSKATAELLEIDPGNRLLTRGPSLRLSAEAVRDQALAASGLLSGKRFGPPVRPPRPSFGLVAAFGGSTDWVTSVGEDRYRRGIYTEIRRSSPHPSMTTFDATSREICTVRRSSSNTPLQALVTLNDPVFVEAAQALARRIVGEHPEGDAEARIRAAFLHVVARPVQADERDALLELLEEARRVFAVDGAAAIAFATDPLGPLDDGLDAAEMAAWTTVAQAVLNMDETFQKY